MSLVNMLPKDYVARKAQKRSNQLCVVLFVLVMAGVLGAAAFSERNYRSTVEVRRRVNQSYQDAARLIEQMQNLETRKGRLLEKVLLTAGLMERVPRSYLLATVTNALPEGASIKEFQLETGVKKALAGGGAKSRYAMAAAATAPASGQATKNDVVLLVTGFAGTDVEVAGFIASMAACPLVNLVELVYSQETMIKLAETRLADGKPAQPIEIPAREFKVVIELKPEADVARRAAEVTAAGAGAPTAARTREAVQ